MEKKWKTQSKNEFTRRDEEKVAQSLLAKGRDKTDTKNNEGEDVLRALLTMNVL